jgi:hypothetical protein
MAVAMDRQREPFMSDVVFMLLSIGFFVGTIGLVHLFERLRGRK